MSFVCLIEIQLHFPDNESLKGKRRELSSVKAQLQRRFGAAVAETEALERWVHSMFPDGVTVELHLKSKKDLL